MLSDVRCEGRNHPIGMDETRPRFSWKLEAQEQEAFQIVIPSVWDSGKIESRSNRMRCPAALPLMPFTRYDYVVRVWTKSGMQESMSFFETGCLQGNNFIADWITVQDEHQYSFPKFQKSFTVSREPVKARLYATVLGVYEVELNGKKVGDSYFAPGYTSYHNHLQYQVYEIRLEEENIIEITLGRGWCRGRFR